MDNLLESIENILNSGDPTVRAWFLVRQNYLPFILCGCYAVFSSKIGPVLMKNRKPFELRTLMIAFNFSLVLTYTICLILVVQYLPKVSKEQLCKGLIAAESDAVYTIATVTWVIYMMKYLELLDTVIFILRKKENQVTFLHVMHHTIVPLLGWIAFRTEKSIMIIIPGILNAAIHIIMYSYYGLAAIGPEVRRHLWWKKYLTQLQMVQFILITLFCAVVAPLSGCSMVISSKMMLIIINPLFFYLFYQYYRSSFQYHKKSEELNANTKMK